MTTLEESQLIASYKVKDPIKYLTKADPIPKSISKLCSELTPYKIDPTNFKIIRSGQYKGQYIYLTHEFQVDPKEYPYWRIPLANGWEKLDPSVKEGTLERAREYKILCDDFKNMGEADTPDSQGKPTYGTFKQRLAKLIDDYPTAEIIEAGEYNLMG